jgi:hypothetical protein
MLYIGLAILLGTVTMVAPLAVLGPSEAIPDTRNGDIPEFIVTAPEEETNTSVEGNVLGMDKMLEAGNYSVQRTAPEPSPAVPMEPSKSATVTDGSPEEPELVVKTVDNSSDLSPIGLLTVPSFLVALGVFVYLRKRIS